jgi:hypothetical protein
MEEFVRKHEAGIHGVLSCFDRMLFRGYLPIMSGWSMAQFLNGLDVQSSNLKPFLLRNAERLKDHAIAMAQKHERPFQYLSSNIRKEDTARKLAERDAIEEGLVCIFSILEPCRTFSFRLELPRKIGHFVGWELKGVRHGWKDQAAVPGGVSPAGGGAIFAGRWWSYMRTARGSWIWPRSLRSRSSRSRSG